MRPTWRDTDLVAACLAIDFGYADECEHDRGLTHLVEHLWFAQSYGPAPFHWGETHPHLVTMRYNFEARDTGPALRAAFAPIVDGFARIDEAEVTATLDVLRLEARSFRHHRTDRAPAMLAVLAVAGSRTDAAAVPEHATPDSVRRHLRHLLGRRTVLALSASRRWAPVVTRLAGVLAASAAADGARLAAEGLTASHSRRHDASELQNQMPEPSRSSGNGGPRTTVAWAIPFAGESWAFACAAALASIAGSRQENVVVEWSPGSRRPLLRDRALLLATTRQPAGGTTSHQKTVVLAWIAGLGQQASCIPASTAAVRRQLSLQDLALLAALREAFGHQGYEPGRRSVDTYRLRRFLRALPERMHMVLSTS